MSEYLLGYSEVERERLERQHRLWRTGLLDTLSRNGLRAGASVLDAGCGPGFLLRDLARVTDRAVGMELSDRSVAAARAHANAAEVRQGDLLADDLGGPYDLVVSRWVLSFLTEPEALVARLAGALAPGGALVIQDYVHDALHLFPDRPEVWRVIEAYREAYRRSGGDLWVAGRLPQMYASAGLEVVEVLPEVKSGAPGTETFQWIEDFAVGHVDTLVDRALITQQERDAFVATWADVRAVPGAHVFSPLQVTVVGRRPDRPATPR